MTPNLIPIYGCAVLTIVVLCLFARQNRKSGWTRHRADNIAEALQDFYTNLGVANLSRSGDEQISPPEWSPLNAEETSGFSAQMLKLRSAVGTSAPVTQNSPVPQREFVHQ